MKIAHRPPLPPWYAIPVSDPVDDRYAARVREVTERGEREYQRLCERLARAERKLAAAQAQKATRKKRLAQLERLVSERRAELAEYQRLMITPVTQDKQIRLRTGLDDHLELGVYKRPRRQETYSSPVTTRRLT